MLDNLFKKYLNVSNYKEHKLYLLARDSSIEALEPKKIADGRIAIYEGYLDGFVIGYVETNLKIAVKYIKLQLKTDTLNLLEIEEVYSLYREDVLHLLKEILNGNI